MTNDWWYDYGQLYSVTRADMGANGEPTSLAEYFSYDGYGGTNQWDRVGNYEQVMRTEKTDVFYLKDGATGSW